jgi:hypothetical protein
VTTHSQQAETDHGCTLFESQAAVAKRADGDGPAAAYGRALATLEILTTVRV